MFALTTLDIASRPVACLEIEGRNYPLATCAQVLDQPALDTSVRDLFEDWPRSLALLEQAAARRSALDGHEVSGPVRHMAPLQYPGKVLCAGANYHDHLAEMNVPNAEDKSAQRLFFFFKPPRQAVVGEGATVHMPIGCQRLDWEIELALVIGKTARNVLPENALDHVAAYTVAVDMSARDLNKAPDTFYKLDWVAGKAHDTSCPLGPRLVPAAFIRDPMDLGLKLSVNGQIKQNARTSAMVFDIREQLAILSRIMTLEPGDLVLTGTPAGVGAPQGTFLKIGDEISATIEDIGTLAVQIQASR
ncbi:fumarylacetoacetate hydrolase family protein [Achromobacter sp. ACM01]|uniref:fumarylacetoacetate hydrolase family protein n=1 Tax=Achromobacter sp. ACM01 TaxID=2769298 RepID=UPI00177CA6DF|nr:fumarylacetoacetate hydrolase family protein [Achromobacter sp. ACM01]MBD9472032.1 fumarylacetoacetate hydrolase family protein [Achromobacter sp. ACM01]